jgi:8-oxo-dGTP pyrophosphatase MutT (NUDIX family)
MKPFNYEQPYIIVGALIEQEGKFLLLEENHEPNKGLWNIPSGKLDFGESPMEAARREAYEEAGVDFSPKSIVSFTSMYRQDVGPSQTGQIHAFRIIYAGTFSGQVSLEHGEPNAQNQPEISRYRWLSPDEISQNTFPIRYADISGAVKNYLSNRMLPLDTIVHLIQKPSL